MRNPLNEMKIRSVPTHNQLEREISETHNVYGKGIRVNHGAKRSHWGWDLLAEEGTPVFSIAEGIVIKAWRDPSKKNYGNQVEVEFEHDGRKYMAFYGHLNDIYVNLFDPAPEGKLLGVTGHTGNAHNLARNQYHLHFEIRIDKGGGSHGAIDPATLLGGDMLICHERPEAPSHKSLLPWEGPQYSSAKRTR